MDSVLLEYLRSGSAWVLVGSGPSIAMGYPSWAELAQKAAAIARLAGPSPAVLEAIEDALADTNYPRVFELVSAEVGLDMVAAELRSILVPRVQDSEIYSELARWPIPVYLTTNYDDQLLTSVAEVDPTYRAFTNSEDHMSLLVPGFSGAIVKLHGDLTTTNGLILTESSYRAVREGADWEYWRTKVRSILQMNPLIILGHSLNDPHVSALLEEAKRGSGVVQPVVWVAPDVPLSEARAYLEKIGFVLSRTRTETGRTATSRP